MIKKSVVLDGVMGIRRQLPLSIVIIILLSAMTFSGLLTLGKSQAASHELLSSIENAGSLQLKITDKSPAGFLTPESVRSIENLSQVNFAFLTTDSFDTVQEVFGGQSTKIPTREYFGDIQGAFEIVAGRLPQSNEAVISMQLAEQMNLDAPAGALIKEGVADYAIVGVFQPNAAFADLNAFALVRADNKYLQDFSTMKNLNADVSSINNFEQVQWQIVGILAPSSPNDVQIGSSDELRDLQMMLEAGLANYGLNLFLLVLLLGIFLIALIVFIDTLLSRKDLGRRRALGASRIDIMTIIISRIFAAAVIALVVSNIAALGLGLLAYLPLSFLLSLDYLVLLAALIASIIPGIFAANADPVRILRTA